MWPRARHCLHLRTQARHAMPKVLCLRTRSQRLPKRLQAQRVAYIDPRNAVTRMHSQHATHTAAQRCCAIVVCKLQGASVSMLCADPHNGAKWMHSQHATHMAVQNAVRLWSVNYRVPAMRAASTSSSASCGLYSQVPSPILTISIVSSSLTSPPSRTTPKMPSRGKIQSPAA